MDFIAQETEVAQETVLSGKFLPKPGLGGVFISYVCFASLSYVSFASLSYVSFALLSYVCFASFENQPMLTHRLEKTNEGSY